MPIICRFNHVSMGYLRGKIPLPVLNEVDWSPRPGKATFLFGPSGSGKSTIIALLGLLDLPQSGEVLLDGISSAALKPRDQALFRKTRVGLVAQNFNLVPSLNLKDNILLPFLAAGLTKEIRQRAEGIFRDLDLIPVLTARPGDVSGGECQRAAVARALVKKPDLILADEPTGSLDPASRLAVMELIRDQARVLKATLIVVSHDHSLRRPEEDAFMLKAGDLEAFQEENHV